MKYSRFRLYSTASNYLDTIKYMAAPPLSDYKRDVEMLMSDMFDVNEVLLVNQARLGIYHLIKAHIKKDGRKKVIVTPYTLFDVINVIIAAGGEPVFVDLANKSLDIDFDHLSNAIRDDAVAAVIITHYHTPCSNISQIVKICRNYNVTSIEDCAIALGGKSDGRYLGTIADFGVFSFGRMKNISAYYGGAIVSNSSAVINDIRVELSKYPLIANTRILSGLIFNLTIEFITSPLAWTIAFQRFFSIGYKYDINAISMLIRPDKNMQSYDTLPTSYMLQISQLQCKIVYDQFKHIFSHMQARHKKAKIYYSILGGAKGITMLFDEVSQTAPFLEFPILVDRRDTVFNKLLDQGVDCRKYYYRNCAQLEIFKTYQAACPNAEYIQEHILLLPVYPSFPDQEVERLANAVKNIVT